MSVPNMKWLVEDLKAKYPAEWATAHRGGPNTEDFVKRFAWEANKIDPRIGLNGKRGDPGDLSDDCVCVRDPGKSRDVRTGELVSVMDFIGGAGGANPQPAWGEVWDPNSIPTAATWIQPKDPGAGVPPKPKPPVKKPYPGDAYFIAAVGEPLELDYMLTGQRLNAGSATWFARTIWDHVNEGLTLEESVAKHRPEWKAALGLPQD